MRYQELNAHDSNLPTPYTPAYMAFRHPTLLNSFTSSPIGIPGHPNLLSHPQQTTISPCTFAPYLLAWPLTSKNNGSPVQSRLEKISHIPPGSGPIDRGRSFIKGNVIHFAAWGACHAQLSLGPKLGPMHMYTAPGRPMFSLHIGADEGAPATRAQRASVRYTLSMVIGVLCTEVGVEKKECARWFISIHTVK